MLFIKAIGNPIENLPKEQQEEHINKVGGFIHRIARQGKLINAQPLVPNGMNLSNADGSLSEQPINEQEEMIVGYYHFKAEYLAEATTMAKADPRF
ncbi:MAG: hypothetical protein ACI8SE_001788 [Bacteroidia bacterium]|jgi:hypothetical protein